jgi:hypothetical protein
MRHATLGKQLLGSVGSGTSQRAGVEVVPWSDHQAAGLTIMGRF